MTTLRIAIITLVSIGVLQRSAGAKPSPEELVPFAIPTSIDSQSPFAQLLKSACDTIAGHSNDIKPFAKLKDDKRPSVFNAEEIATWAALNKQKHRTPAKLLANARKTALSAVVPLVEACNVLADKKHLMPFTSDTVKTLRAFRAAPVENHALVAELLDTGTVKQQSLTPASLIPTGSLVDNVIGGLAQFIYDRAKAEALSFLTKRLQKLVCADDRKPFFENVCVAFAELDNSVSLSAIGSYLTAAARKDLENLPDVLLVYALDDLTTGSGDSRTCSDTSACNALTAARIALAFYMEVRRGRRPLDIARSLHRIEFTKLQLQQGSSVIKVVTHGSQILDALMQQRGWEDMKDGGAGELPYLAVGTLLTLEELMKLDSVKTDEHLVEWFNDRDLAILRTLQSLVQRTAVAHDQIQQLLVKLDEQRDAAAESGEPAFAPFSSSDVARLATTTLSMLADAGDATASMVGLGRTQVTQHTPKPTDAAVSSQSDTDLTPEATPEKVMYGQRLKRVAQLGEAIANGNAPADIALAAHDLYIRVVGKVQSKRGAKVVATVKTALPFVSQLARATSADDVVKILEASAAPTGTSSRKAKEKMVSLTALVGATAGQELIEQEWGTPAGVFAPVGIHASWPVGSTSVGCYLSVLNLGNLVGQRFDEDTKMEDGTETTISPKQTAEVTQVFSPGLFGTIGIAGPFVAGVGGQFVPSAREVTITSMTSTGEMRTETDKRAALQLLVFVAIDVTLFPF